MRSPDEVKQNITALVAKGASMEEVDSYVQAEGYTAESLTAAPDRPKRQLPVSRTLCFKRNAVSNRTISEIHFEKLCANRGVVCERIPESTTKSADYRVSVASMTLIVEVKQLDPSDEDERLGEVWGTPQSPGAVAPSDRVQGLLDDGYSQVKRSSEEKLPTMIVVYNNSGEWNWLDTFTIAKAMFGSYGIVLGLQPDQTIEEIGRGYLGQRKVTKETFRFLSAVGVLKHTGSEALELCCYHNPFAKLPIEPISLAKFANAQYVHPNPHKRGFVPWEPKQIET